MDSDNLSAPAGLTLYEQVMWWRKHALCWRGCAMERKRDNRGLFRQVENAGSQIARLQHELSELRLELLRRKTGLD